MSVDVVVPKLDPAMTEARIARWLKSEGDFVEKGEPVLEIETSKALVEIEAPIEGYVGPIVMTENAVGMVGDVVTCILSAGEAQARPRREGVTEPTYAGSGDAAETATGDIASQPREDLKISPYARRLARDMRVDLSGVRGSGQGGRIVAEDVQRAAQELVSGALGDPADPALSVTSGIEIPMQGVRLIIAGRMQKSHQETAPVTLMAEADASGLVAARDRFSERNVDSLGFALTYNDLLVDVVARGLREFRYMNCRLEGDMIRLLDDIHVGVAIDTERGLVVAVIHDADKKDLFEIGRELHRLTDKARAGKLMPDELGGGTFTITNLGMYEIDAFTPIINFPEAAILGVGSI
jgi:pyruvate dehydrogenase E2 component (dihydrolipoamide acetyltransferase)